MNTDAEQDARESPASLPVIGFTRSHGLGNDYVVLDGAALPAGWLTPARAVLLCDRHHGVGSDGILLVMPSAHADAGVRIVNPDGSEAEKSGNGLRIVARWLWDARRVPSPRFTVETAGGVVACECRPDGGVVVEMGRASFDARAVPVAGMSGDVVDAAIALPGGERVTITAVSVGNPHCVVFADVADEAECRRLGPVLERHPVFPNRTNVQLARVLAPDALEIRIWERGAGYTLASGSSACGAAAAAVRTGRCVPGPIAVRMPGGQLVVLVRPDWSLRLDGPVEEICRGTLSPDLLARLATA
jgi:diaminopimelate epimerase